MPLRFSFNTNLTPSVNAPRVEEVWWYLINFKNWTNCKMVNWGTLYVTLGFFLFFGFQTFKGKIPFFFSFFFFFALGKFFCLFVCLFVWLLFLLLAPPIIISTYLAVLFFSSINARVLVHIISQGFSKLSGSKSSSKLYMFSVLWS